MKRYLIITLALIMAALTVMAVANSTNIPENMWSIGNVVHDGEAVLTRGILITILGNMYGIDVSEYTESIYADVPADAYYAPYIAWAAESGIVNGTGNGTFSPGNSVTREQLAKVLLGYYNYIGDGPVGAWAIRLGYADLSEASDWAFEGIMFCTIKGLMQSREGDLFYPKGEVTFAEIADIMEKMDDTTLKAINKEENTMDKLLYQGHGSFRLTLGSGEVIYIDPYAGEGYDQPADLILVTHQHPDHNQIGLVSQKDGCIVFQNSDAIVDGEYQSADIAGVHIEPVQAYNANHDVTKCVGYLVTVGDKLLYFAGDTSKTDQMTELAGRNIDYAFLPMDGRFNMDIPEAIECAELIQAKHTVPVHMSPGSLFDRDRAEQFVTPSALIVEAGQVIEL